MVSVFGVYAPKTETALFGEKACIFNFRYVTLPPEFRQGSYQYHLQLFERLALFKLTKHRLEEWFFKIFFTFMAKYLNNLMSNAGHFVGGGCSALMFVALFLLV